MKRNLIAIFAIMTLLAGEAVLAAKCKFREDTNDMFSGVPTLRTAWNKNGGIVSAVKESGQQWLEVKLSYSRISKFLPTQAELDTAIVVAKGANLEVTLKDGTLVELPAIETVQGSSSIGYPYDGGNNDYVTHVHAKFRYALSASTVDALASQNASKIRIQGISQFRDIRIPKKGFKQIKEAVNCLRQGDDK